MESLNDKDLALQFAKTLFKQTQETNEQIKQKMAIQEYVLLQYLFKLKKCERSDTTLKRTRRFFMRLTGPLYLMSSTWSNSYECMLYGTKMKMLRTKFQNLDFKQYEIVNLSKVVGKSNDDKDVTLSVMIDYCLQDIFNFLFITTTYKSQFLNKEKDFNHSKLQKFNLIELLNMIEYRKKPQTTTGGKSKTNKKNPNRQKKTRKNKYVQRNRY